MLSAKWPAEGSHLAAIRSATRDWLASQKLTEEIRSDVVLAVNEAASNAVEHAYRPPPRTGDIVELALWSEAGAICVEIVDQGRWQPPATPELTGGGRGIPLMRQLVDSVLISYDGTGTTVFLRHAVPRPSE